MWIGEIDVFDDDALRAYWEAGRDGDAFERPYATSWTYQAAVVAFRDPGNSMEQHAIAAVEDGETLGTVHIAGPMRDNTHLAYLEVIVRPEHRRRRVGSTLLDAGLETCRRIGRRTVVSEVHMPLVEPPSSVGSRLFESRGFTVASLELHRVLDLPVPEERLDALASSSDGADAGYTLRSFKDRVPDELLDGFCRLQSAFNEQAPLGELALEAEVWDEQRVRDQEARLERQRRHRWATVAIASDGEQVALTELFANDDDAAAGSQSGTLVQPAHRGHRLGTAIKVANLRAYCRDFPAIRTIHSWNAEENAAMVAINDSLGFRPVEYTAEMQLVLSESAT